MSASTQLRLPPNLPYPIKISRITAKPPSQVKPGSTLLEYSFRQAAGAAQASTSKLQPEPLVLFGSWDSPIEGAVESWTLTTGQTITAAEARAANGAVIIKEKCRHDVQIGGMCAVCGEDMTRMDYTGFTPSSIATLPATHLAHGPTVSLVEAKRLAEEQRDWLLKDRKLSLIVDLDQTVVHATVDPTVGEWIAEGRAWEAEQASTTPTEGETKTTKKKKRPPNPNWAALKDVASFRLAPEIAGLSLSMRGRGGQATGEGCVYYIKPRPGWSSFFHNLSKAFDLHIYTMGTRSYALSVLNVLDPDHSLFGNRVLSRDESGNMTQKSLRRLFPVDTSMVVVIDDRGDVWEWCENLVKVVPYDFFVGIGDINSAFLPKQEPLVPLSVSKSAEPSPLSMDSTASAVTAVPDDSAAASITTPEASALSPGSSSTSVEVEPSTLMQIKEQGRTLEAQMEERPLAKEQEKLNDGTPANSEAGDSDSGTGGMEDDEVEPRALLRNDDKELERIERVLGEVHRNFFIAYDEAMAKGDNMPAQKGRVGYDVTSIIPRIRRRTFEGVHLLFSSVIPLDQDPERSEIWKLARAFGGTCHSDLSNDVTHVVAAKPGTMKVDMAHRKGGIHIVWLSWFTDSIALWERQEETPYLIEVRTPPPPRKDPLKGGTGTALSESSSSMSVIDIQGDDPGGVAQEMLDDFEDDSSDDLDDDDDFEMDAEDELKPIAEDTWQDATDEVDAYLNESDSEFEGEEGAIMEGSENGSTPGTPKSGANLLPGSNGGIKRQRSVTPSRSGVKQPGLSVADMDDPNLRSPLAKRKKLVDRRGTSSLRVEVSVPDPGPTSSTHTNGNTAAGKEEPMVVVKEDAVEETPSGSVSDDDDFLAGELEEEEVG